MRTTTLIAALFVLAVMLPACDDGGYPDANTRMTPSGPATGILLNAQNSEGDTVDAAHPTTVGWSVVDAAGNAIFSNTDVVSTQKGIAYEFKRAKATNEQRFRLGSNPKEIRISSFARVPAGKTEDGKQELEKFQFVVDDATAAELRGMSNLMDLVKRANVVILLGKIGE